ncbi:hypothetical protein V8G54_013317 [Vigna mungo]|uniref:non-specific serine/threonine protein kinase n=1 Tax=Vigna mungo TaxID=3915 RepID=A0AAQ3S4Q5_VIGMU
MNFEKLSSGYYNHELFIPGQFYPMGYDTSNDRYLEGLRSKGKLCCTANDKSKGWNFSLKEIEDATNGFAKENELGRGDNGIVYLGLLPSNRQVVVKRLELFASQMEAIGLAKHNNLVKLLGYCAEGAYRMSVSEYAEHESLHHWLHEFPAQISPLTWDIRKNIIHCVAKGLAYLHDEVKPKILHGSLKATNILLDHKWNPKISDFGLVEVLSSKRSHIILEVKELSSNLTEGNDIYDFGLLIMEIVSGKIPSYHGQTQVQLPILDSSVAGFHFCTLVFQTNIVDWFKSMISNGKMENAIDSKLLKMPSSKALKQVALVALRCVDPDVNPRLKMRDVVCMLETNILLFEERQIAMKTLEANHSPQNQKK